MIPGGWNRSSILFSYLRAGVVKLKRRVNGRGTSLQQQGGRDRVHYANFCPVACEEWRKHWRLGGQGIIEHLEVSWCRCGNIDEEVVLALSFHHPLSSNRVVVTNVYVYNYAGALSSSSRGFSRIFLEESRGWGKDGERSFDEKHLSLPVTQSAV